MATGAVVLVATMLIALFLWVGFGRLAGVPNGTDGALHGNLWAGGLLTQ